ncbi:MAG TPA: response regulator [Rhizomicrobium sp.]|jgi:PAS domain S-box-containing protein
MSANKKINVLLVDDQHAKLLSYEAILEPLGENLVKASSAKEALEHLLKMDIAVVLVDVCMPDLDGFELAAMIREHPRFQRTAIIFISAINISEADFLRGYSAGAVDYVPVPVVPEMLRAKVRVFAELYRTTRELEQLNRELEHRISERTAALEASTDRLLRSERGRSLALAAANMGAWEYDVAEDRWSWDEGHCRIFGLDPQSFNSQVFVPSGDLIRSFFHEADWAQLRAAIDRLTPSQGTLQMDVRIVRADGRMRWCSISAAATFDAQDALQRVDGVTLDVTERREAEERQALLAREVDHRARNALAIVQAIVRLAKANNIKDYVYAVEGRIRALAQTHELLSQTRWQGADMQRIVNDEISPYRLRGAARISVAGPSVILPPEKAQVVALSLHELATNAAKYGALSNATGQVKVHWELREGKLALNWRESQGPATKAPTRTGFGMKIITTSVRQQPGGEVSFDWRPEGVDCNLKFTFGGEAADGIGRPAGDPNVVAFKPAAGPRILLVEDEPLVGMLVRDMLEEGGWSVTGPVSNLHDALDVARTGDFDGAVLDVNLGGSFAYSLAELLQSRDVPFVFVTGYAHEQLDERYTQVPALQKPIEFGALNTALQIALGRCDQSGQGQKKRR